jgi:tetratricopeptide (TPR) repeat protein
LQNVAAIAEHADVTGLTEIARWLNSHSDSEQVLALVTPEKTAESESLLLARLDALANLKRWDEIDALLKQSDAAIPSSVIESLRARSTSARGSQSEADVHWERAIALANKDPLRLRFIANFAERTGATEPALRAYESLSRFPDQAQFALRGRERLLAKTGDMAAAKASAERLVAISNDDLNAQAELVHYNLLLFDDVDANAQKAQALVQKAPTRLSFRVTAALGCLRKGDAAAALAQFKGPPIDWQRTPPGWRAVYAAVLLANNRIDEARAMIEKIPLDQLNDAERQLISGT